MREEYLITSHITENVRVVVDKLIKIIQHG